jgi:hypothetical protein
MEVWVYRIPFSTLSGMIGCWINRYSVLLVPSNKFKYNIHFIFRALYYITGLHPRQNVLIMRFGLLDMCRDGMNVLSYLLT